VREHPWNAVGIAVLAGSRWAACQPQIRTCPTKNLPEDSGHTESLLESLRGLAKTFVALVQTRIEIFASEIDEERTRVGRILCSRWSRCSFWPRGRA